MGSKMSTRDKWRWVCLLVGAPSCAIGYFFPTPLVIMEKQIVANSFLVLGLLALGFGLGLIQAAKNFLSKSNGPK